ncbi:MAG: queuosine precursor transporter [Bacteroidales bacterium]|nr:queuosine precursor transporter [Bacteroidales bacterium]
MKHKAQFSVIFLCMAVLFTVCLVTSNLLATKVFAIGERISLPCAVLVFPISYILNDCFTEVYGYRKARLVIWLGFAMNFLVVLLGGIAVLLPAASFWQGGEHFNFVFAMAPRIAIASLLAFLVGSTLNSLVLSKMKVASKGRGFGWRAVVSSLVGELCDSLIFMPIAFWGTPLKTLAWMMLVQVSFKVLYEIVILPVTNAVVIRLKTFEGEDVYDTGISYNLFKIKDIQ